MIKQCILVTCVLFFCMIIVRSYFYIEAFEAECDDASRSKYQALLKTSNSQAEEIVDLKSKLNKSNSDSASCKTAQATFAEEKQTFFDEQGNVEELSTELKTVKQNRDFLQKQLNTASDLNKKLKTEKESCNAALDKKDARVEKQLAELRETRQTLLTKVSTLEKSAAEMENQLKVVEEAASEYYSDCLQQ